MKSTFIVILTPAPHIFIFFEKKCFFNSIVTVQRSPREYLFRDNITFLAFNFSLTMNHLFLDDCTVFT